MPKEGFREAHACLFAPLFLATVTIIKSPQSEEGEKTKSIPSYEQFFLSHAKRLNKEILALEPDGSLNSCESMSKNEIRDMLMSPMLLYKDEKKKNDFLRLQQMSSKAFKEGLGQENYNFAIEAMNFDNAYKQAFQHWMNIRNSNMAKLLALQLSKSASEVTFFVLVGSLHLYGEQGMLALLKNDGFVIEKLN